MAPRDDTEGGLRRSFSKPCLLMLLAEGPSHGYDLLEQIRRLGIRSADAGGLYRVLRTMEKEELVSSWWEPSQAGPARRTYALTDHGQQTMRASAEALRDVHRLLGGVLERYDATSTAGTGARP